MRGGIAFVHQELNLFDNLDVAANVFIGREPLQGGPLRLVDQRGAACRGCSRCCDRLGADFAADTPVAELSLAQMQLVEIAKALSLNARLVIMDEPTSSLTAVGDRPAAAGDRRPEGRRRQRHLHLAPPATRSSAAPTAWSCCATAGWSASWTAAEIDARRDDPPDDRPRPEVALYRRRPSRRATPCSSSRELRTPTYPARAGQPVGARGRDPRPGRPGRLRPHRAGARGLRHRPPAGRRDRHQRRGRRRSPRRAPPSTAASTSIPEDRKRSGLLLDFSDRREHLAARPGAPFARAGIVAAGRGGRATRERQRDQPEHPHAQRRQRGRRAVGRQPAEGRAGQVAVAWSRG